MSDNLELPSEGELAELPKGSLATYAIRCALRALPLLFSWKEPSKNSKRAVVIINRSFHVLSSSVDGTAAKQAANAAYDAVNIITDETKDSNDYSGVIKAADAASAATRVIGVTRDVKHRAPYKFAKLASMASDSVTAISAARADYERLKATKIEITDSLETGYLGDLWNGFPPGWYTKAMKDYDKTIAEWERELGDEVVGNMSGSSKIGISTSAKLTGLISDDADLPVEFYIDPGDAQKETIQNVLECLSDLHIAAGGFGLEFIADDMNIKSMEGVTK